MIRSAVIGAGAIARQHLDCVRSIQGARIVGVCDLSPSVAEAAAERTGAEAWFTDASLMLQQTKPDIVHITTPPQTHFRLAKEALEAGAHVLVEKPITASLPELEELISIAEGSGRFLVEDHNYLFNDAVQQLLTKLHRGELGEIVHVEVMIGLDILGPGSRFVDPNVPHPAVNLPGGAIADFLTHLSYLACAFTGPHKSVMSTWHKRDTSTKLPSDEMRALIDGERATGFLIFSSHAQPDVFLLRVVGSRARAEIHLFEPRATYESLKSVPKPLLSFFNGLSLARDEWMGALKSPVRKLSGGPGAYEGLWALVRKTYEAIAQRGPSPVTTADIRATNALVAELMSQAKAS